MSLSILRQLLDILSRLCNSLSTCVAIWRSTCASLPLRCRHFRYTLVGTPPCFQNHCTISRYRPPKINSTTYLFFCIKSIMAVNANQVFIAVIGKLQLVHN